MFYFYSERPPLLQRSVARHFGGVSQIYIIYIYIIYKYILYIYLGKTLQSSVLAYHKGVPDYAPSTAMIHEPRGTIVFKYCQL